MRSIGNNKEFRGNSLTHLEIILDTNRNDLKELAEKFYLYYHPNYEKKKSGGKRKIDRPVGKLKQVQKQISQKLLSNVDIPTGFFGYVRGKSYISNAVYHLFQPVVISIDIRDFFPSVRDHDVYHVYRYLLGYSTKISSLLTRITTYNHGLPQGSPTSGYLGNLCLLPIYKEIETFCNKMNLKLSFYADDITISGVISKASSTTIINRVIQILHKSGFSSKNKKIAVMPRSRRQMVTGLMINNGKLLLPIDKIKSYRKRLLNPSTSQKSKSGILQWLFQVNSNLPKKVLKNLR